MKTNISILTIALALCASLAIPAVAKDEKKEDHKKHVAPKGGKLLDKTEPHAEFVIEKDRTVTINFYNDDLKPVAVETQTVTVIADAKDGKAKLEFEKKGDSLVSKTKLPEGDGYNIVVQLKQTAEAKPQNIRFKLDMAECDGCKKPEYACSCDEH